MMVRVYYELSSMKVRSPCLQGMYLFQVTLFQKCYNLVPSVISSWKCRQLDDFLYRPSVKVQLLLLCQKRLSLSHTVRIDPPNLLLARLSISLQEY